MDSMSPALAFGSCVLALIILSPKNGIFSRSKIA